MNRFMRSCRLPILSLIIFLFLSCQGATAPLFAYAATKSIDIPLDYVRSAKVAETTIFDVRNKTLIIEFKEPMRVTSTLEGERKGILTVGNHYTPPPCWDITHRLGLDKSRSRIYKAIGKSAKNSCFLFTGADMGNLSVQKAQFKDMTVYALVTAGVETNALRMSVDQGLFYEPGTINVILMTNMKLSSRAMARGIISATEAKTAAMQDLDVRSTAGPRVSQATGTGTDEVLLIEGRGTGIDNAGGHSKLGELIAETVYDGVKEAVYRQNGITARRNVFRRLRERRIDLYGMLRECASFADSDDLGRQVAQLEGLLHEPRYASFMESAFALSDAYQRGLICELETYRFWCRQVAEEIAGKKITEWKDPLSSEDIPVVVRSAFNALLNGIRWRTSQE
ncbi:MAG: adenosylcobinamide amidohydrolase [Syntrophobacteraceae bacterium]